MSPAPLTPEALDHAVGQPTLDVRRQGCDVRKGSMPLYNTKKIIG
ncbi:hypothetical protein J2T13_001359 [Paenibacillus sp. DS2015]